MSAWVSLEPKVDLSQVESESTAPDQVEEDLPPLADWPPQEILDRWAARRDAHRRRVRSRRRMTGLVLLVAVAAAGVFVLTRSSSHGPAAPKAAAVPNPGRVALSLDLGLRQVVAVVAVPAQGPPVVMAIPTDAEVDITGGSLVTVGQAMSDPGLMVAAVQAAVDRRVEHHLVMDSIALASVVDALGGVEVQTEAIFTSGAEVLGPGPEHLMGGAVLAYLDQATDEDITARWEEVLAGVFSAKAKPGAWSSLIGTTDDIDAARALLARAQTERAIVLELPTAPAPDGGVAVDVDAATELIDRHFGGSSTDLVRVVVLNGNGDPLVGSQIAALLAPQGFRVVAAQDAVSFHVTQTEVVAGSDQFEPEAEKVQALLGVGMVYVDSQPTGIADITIKVGKDFTSG
jgi:LytR cell envelope-related transcriptional attenuator/LytR_cpsA_psr family